MQGFRPRLRAWPLRQGERWPTVDQRRRLPRLRRTANAKRKYLVGGMLRPTVKQISEACSKTRVTADILQLAPVCSFNAFEFAYPETFANEAFLLLDMGHLQSTVMIGSQKELVLVRSIDYGGKALRRTPSRPMARSIRNAARVMMQQGDAGMAEICRSSLPGLATEVRNSIGFFEGQHEAKHSSDFCFRRARPDRNDPANPERRAGITVRNLGSARNLRGGPATGQTPGVAARICLAQCRLRRRRFNT